MARRSKLRKTESIKSNDEEKVSGICTVKIIIPGSVEPLLVQIAKQETIYDVKQAVLERPDCYFRTCTSIHSERGNKLDELSTVGSVIGESDNLTLKLMDRPYSFKDTVIHLNRFNETIHNDIFTSYIEGQSKLTISLLSELVTNSMDDIRPDSQSLSEIMPFHQEVDEFPLRDFYMDYPKKAANKFLTSFRFSFYNPPTGPRKLEGHLIYIEIITAENIFYGITCTSDGFFINSSTEAQFCSDIINLDQRYATIDALLSSVSSIYRKKMKEFIILVTDRHPFEHSAVHIQKYPWLGVKFSQTENLFRALDTFANNGSSDDMAMFQVRDWNDELQTVRTMPITNESERTDYFRFLHKITVDMADSATKGAVFAIDGKLNPINDTDDDRYKLYLWNNMFFCIACDTRDYYKDFGGEFASHVAAGLDVKSIHYLTSLQINDFHFLGTTVLDYRGFRLVVQSVLPGIFNRTQSQSLEYGSMDHGKTISSDSRFTEGLKKLSGLMCSLPSKYTDGCGDVHELHTSIETKGIVGTDGRKYLLDLFRMLPPDPTFLSNEPKLLKEDGNSTYFVQAREFAASNGFQFPLNYPHRLSCFRPEFYKLLIQLNNINQQEKIAEEAGDPDIDIQNKKDTIRSVFLASFNSDCYDIKINRPPSEESTLKKCRNSSRMAASIMVVEHIPVYLSNVIENSNDFIFDHQSFTDSLHSKGINIRYIGYISHLTKSIPNLWFLHKISLMEMICRSAKRMFRSAISRVPQNEVAVMVSHFLNCFLGSHSSPKFVLPSANKQLKPKKTFSIYKIKWSKLTPSSFWKNIVDDVKCCYGYSLYAVSLEEFGTESDIKPVSLLKTFSTMVGIQIMLKDYDFSNRKTPTFCPNDILNLFPVTKPFKNPIPEDINEKLNNVQNFSLSNNSLLLKYQEDLKHLIVYFNQIYGPLTYENAVCHSSIARLYYSGGECSQAFMFQYKATILYERILGIDHYLTIIAYHHLAIYCKSIGKKISAVNLFNRARYLIGIAYGTKHPFVHEINRNLLALYFDLGQSQSAFNYARTIIDYIQEFDSTNIKGLAEIHQIIGAIHYNNSNYRLALTEEKKAYNYLSQSVLDKDSPIIKSCQSLLDLYLKSAVTHEKAILMKKGAVTQNNHEKKITTS